MTAIDADAFVPRTQNSFRADQVAKLFPCSANHIVKLIKHGEIVVPKERIDTAPSGASILVPRESIVDFVRGRTRGSSWWKKNRAKKKRRAARQQAGRRSAIE
jgi:hypothetical protein